MVESHISLVVKILAAGRLSTAQTIGRKTSILVSNAGAWHSPKGGAGEIETFKHTDNLGYL